MWLTYVVHLMFAWGSPENFYWKKNLGVLFTLFSGYMKLFYYCIFIITTYDLSLFLFAFVEG